MGAGAGVYQCRVGSLVDFYIAGRGWLVRGGRLQCNNHIAFPDVPDADINDRAAMHAAELDSDSDETIGINYDSDPPYEEAYDGDMEDDHPMVLALMGGTHPSTMEQEVMDGWATPEVSTPPPFEPWEPITNTRGHDREQDPYNWDWIPDFGTESDEP